MENTSNIQPLHQQRCLVAGGAGFIGSHLCRALLEEGNYVICLDNLATGRMNNIADMLSNPLFEFIQQDVCTPIDLDVDMIYNLACPASFIYCQNAPIHTIETNIIGSKNLLDMAAQNDCPIFLASTSEVYGDPQVHPQHENYWGNVNPNGPRSCYDEGKRCAESLYFAYHDEHGVDIRIARFFNTYGPGIRKDDGRVTSNFVVQALTGQSLTIYGDGTQTRSMCYVDDLVDGIIALMEREEPITGPINLGNPQEITILELAELILCLTKSESTITFKPLPTDDPQRRRPDITLAKKELDWAPNIALPDGMMRTISYFKEMLLEAERSHDSHWDLTAN